MLHFVKWFSNQLKWPAMCKAFSCFHWVFVFIPCYWYVFLCILRSSSLSNTWLKNLFSWPCKIDQWVKCVFCTSLTTWVCSLDPCKSVWRELIPWSFPLTHMSTVDYVPTCSHHTVHNNKIGASAMAQEINVLATKPFPEFDPHGERR